MHPVENLSPWVVGFGVIISFPYSSVDVIQNPRSIQHVGWWLGAIISIPPDSREGLAFKWTTLLSNLDSEMLIRIGRDGEIRIEGFHVHEQAF
jgi:hypothetical protein